MQKGLDVMEPKKTLLKPRAVKFQKDMIRWSGSSEILRKATNFMKIANQRLMILAAFMLCFFVAIAFQLVRVQVYQQEEYQFKLENYTRSYQRISPPRGQMYDRNGKLMVENVSLLNMIYTPLKNISETEEWELARKVAETFEIPIDKLTIRERKDAYLKLYPKESNALITEAEWSLYTAKELDDMDIYEFKMERISEDMYAGMDEIDLKASIVKMAMDMPTSNQPKTIKEDMTFDEASYLMENKEIFRGFDVSSDWKRNYLYDATLRSIFGKVSTSKQGLPANLSGLYLAKGYSRNTRVGQSGLELQYEYLLKGTNSVLNQEYDKMTGLPIVSEIEPGKKGNDLKLSVDIGLQLDVERIVEAALKEASQNQYRRELEDIYVVMLDVVTGDVLSMVGKHLNEDKTISDNPENTIWAGLEAGSVVKGATMYMGFEEGLVKQGEILLDEPIYLLATPVKKSWRNMGNISDIDALKWSSNVYMFRIAMRLGKANYVPNGALLLRNTQSFQTIRNYFSKFGLGMITGIDVPGETIGYLGDISQASPGHLLDFAIGQYDNYTTIELAQYVATIANNGTKVQPRFLLEAYETGTDHVVYENRPQVLSVLEGKKSLQRIQQGFRECVTTGYCATYLNQVSQPVAAKSGTAEARKKITNADGSVEYVSAPNSTFVAYGPYEKPRVAMACAAPNAWIEKSQINICQKITADALQAYFNRHPK